MMTSFILHESGVLTPFVYDIILMSQTCLMQLSAVLTGTVITRMVLHSDGQY